MIEVERPTVTVMVGDLDRAADFYTRLLGFDVLYRAGEHFAMLERSGFLLGLHPTDDVSGGARSRDVTIGLSVADIGAAVAELEARGVDFPHGVVDDDGAVLRADFVDPDGTGLYLVQMVRGGPSASGG